MTVINTNISANITANSLAKNERAMSQTMERLSTGMRINSASDDAAGLAISERMTSQVKGLDQAARNANDAISMLQTADGAAIEITNMLQRMRELTVQASSATNTAPDIANMDLEFKALASEIDRIVDSTQWNGENILNGEGGDNGSFTFQIGANDGQSVTVDFSDFNLAAGAGATEAVAGVAGVNQVDFVAAVTGVDQVDAVAAVDQVNYSAEVQGVTGSLQVEQADAKGAAAVPGVAAVEGVAATFTQAMTDAEAALITGNLVISDGTTSVTVGAADITDLDSIVAAVNGQGLDFEVAKNEAGDGLVMTNSATGTAGTTPTVTATLSSGSIASVATGVTGVDAKAEQRDFAGVQAEFTLAFTDANAAALKGNFVISDGTTSVSIADSAITDLDSIVAAVQATGDLDFNLAKNEAGTGLVATYKEVGAIGSAPTITASNNSTAEYTVTLTDADVVAMDQNFVIGDGTNSVTINTDNLASDTVAALAAAINTASTGANTLDFSVAADGSGLVMTATAEGAMAQPSITSTQTEELSIFKVDIDDTKAGNIEDNTFTIGDGTNTVTLTSMTGVSDVASLVTAIQGATGYGSLDFEVSADGTAGLTMTARSGQGAIAEPSVAAGDGSGSSLALTFANPTVGVDADTFGASGDFGTNDAGFASVGATGGSSVTGDAARAYIAAGDRAASPAIAAVEGVAATYTQAITDAEAALITSNLVISDGTSSVTVGAADITDLDSIVAAVNGQGLDFEVAKNEAGDGLVMTNSATGTAGTTPTVTATLSTGSIAAVATGVTGVDAKAEQRDFAGVQAEFTLAFTDANAAAVKGNFVISDGTTSVTIDDGAITDLDSIVAAVNDQGLNFEVAKNEAGNLVMTYKEPGAIENPLTNGPTVVAEDVNGTALGGSAASSVTGVAARAYIAAGDRAASPAISAVEGVAATYTQAITDAEAALITGNLVISDGTSSVTVGAADITDLDSIVAAVNGQGLDFEVAKNEAGDGLVMTNSATGTAGTTPTFAATLSTGSIDSVATGVTGVDAKVEQMDFAGVQAQFTLAFTDANAAALEGNFVISDGITSVSIADSDITDLDSIVAAVQATGDLDFNLAKNEAGTGLVATFKEVGAASAPTITASKTSTAEYTVTLTDADVAAMDGDFVIGDGTNSVTIETDKLASDTVAALATAINTASTGLNTLDFSVASDASGLVMTATAKGAMDEPTITSAQNEVLSIFKVGLDDTAAAAIVDNTFTISDASGTTVSVDDMTNVNDVASLVNAIKMAADYTSLDFEVTADSTIGLVMTARTGEGAIAQPSVTATDGSSSLVGSFSNPTPGEDADTFGASGDFGTNDAGYTSFGATGSSSVTGEAAIEGVRFEAYSAAVDFQAAVETVAYQAEVAFVAGVTEVAEVTGVTEVAGVTGVTGVAEVAEVAAKGAVVMTQNLGGMTATNATLTTTSANMLETLDKAINGVTTQRATFGSVMNRLEYTVDNLANVSQNTSASLSRIADADYAAETTELARTQIIQQAGTAMLSQANQQAQSVLALLK